MKTYTYLGYSFTAADLEDRSKIENSADRFQVIAFAQCLREKKLDEMNPEEKERYLKNEREFQRRINSEAGL